MNAPYLNAALIQLEELAANLKSAQQSFQDEKPGLPYDVDEQRRLWLRERPRSMGGREETEWRRLDPEVQGRDDVRTATRRVAELKSQLNQAEVELNTLIDAGTSRTRLAKQILWAGSVLRSLLLSLERSVVEELIFDQFSTRDLKEVPPLILEQAKFSPWARRFARFAFAINLDPHRLDYSELELSAAYAATASAIARLVEVIREG